VSLVGGGPLAYPPLPSPPLPFPPSPPLPSPPFPSIPFPFSPLPLALPLEVGPFIADRGSGERFGEFQAENLAFSSNDLRKLSKK